MVSKEKFVFRETFSFHENQLQLFNQSVSLIKKNY